MFKNKPFFKSIAFLTAFAFIVSFGFFVIEPVTAQAASLSSYQAQQKKIQQQLSAKKQEIKKAENDLSSYQAQVRMVNANLEAAEAQLAAANSALAQAEAELAATNAQLEEEQESLETQVNAYSERMRQTYIDGNVSLLDVILESTSMEDFITRAYYMEKILEYDNTMIDTINESIESIEEQKATLEQQKTDLQVIKSAKESAVAELEAAKVEKYSLISTAQAQKEQAQDEYDSMLADSNKLNKEIQTLIAKQKQQAAQNNKNNSTNNGNSGNGNSGNGNSSSGNYATGTGKYMWPLPSSYKNITSNYGMRMHPTKHVYKMHTGIDISAPAGTSIYAADSGTVILARYYGSYGNTVIIDHGGNVVTLYAHMSSIGVSVGQSVARGQTIGRVGTTGASTGNHLHFEVRVGGSCVSPWGYVSK